MVSPHRAKRPWQGKNEKKETRESPSYDSKCYLCPGNTRANGEINQNYKDVYVFENDYPALQKESVEFKIEDELLIAQSEKGICKVVCFSPDHSKSLANMESNEIEKVIKTWQVEYETLGSYDFINYVQIFENKGELMGCSNPHPHGQIWSQSSIPNEVSKKDKRLNAHFKKSKKSLLSDYLKQELAINERVIYKNDHYIILSPYWAIWPFETMIIPIEHQKNILSLSNYQRDAFADAISKITKAYDKLFDCFFPYSSGIHQAPTNGLENNHWHWHMSFYPPLLRSASVKKFMVGYEMFGSPQRDITIEQAALKIKEFI